jgi:hypothetical protein
MPYRASRWIARSTRPADEKRNGLAVDGTRSDRAGGTAHRLAPPGLVEQLELLVPAPAARVEILAADSEVILPAADAYAEDEAATGQLVEAGGLLRKQHHVSSGAQQHVGEEADALRCAGSGRQRHQLLVVRVGDPAKRAEGGEAQRLGPDGEVDQQPAVWQVGYGVR